MAAGFTSLGCGGVYGCDQLGRPLLFKMEFNSIPKHVREKARKVGKEALREYVQGGRQHDARVTRELAQLRWRRVDADKHEREKWPPLKSSIMPAGVASGKSNLDNVHLLRIKMRNKASLKALDNQREGFRLTRPRRTR